MSTVRLLFDQLNENGLCNMQITIELKAWCYTNVCIDLEAKQNKKPGEQKDNKNNAEHDWQ
jgi:hypothetical protein